MGLTKAQHLFKVVDKEYCNIFPRDGSLLLFAISKNSNRRVSILSAIQPKSKIIESLLLLVDPPEFQALRVYF